MKAIKADKSLFLNTTYTSAFSIKEKAKDWALLLNKDSKPIYIVSENVGCVPNSICVNGLETEKLPPTDWILENNRLFVPEKSELDLTDIKKFESESHILLKEFPGHMKAAVSRRLRQDDYAFMLPIYKEINKLLAFVLQHKNIENYEMPNILSNGINTGGYSAKEAALIGAIYTIKCFSAGGHFKSREDRQILMTLRDCFKYSGVIGKIGLSYALEGRMSEVQQRFFASMVNDNELEVEKAVKKIEKDPLSYSPAFLAGVNSALELVKEDTFKGGA